MKHSIALILLMLTLPCAAADWCTRQPLDEEAPAGLSGQYQVIGREARSGKAYSGTLVLGVSKRSYTLSRTIKGLKTQGEAWMEACGPDKMMSLAVHYAAPAAALHCLIKSGAHGDNYYNISCTSDVEKQPGLEAWFQDQ